MGKSSSRLRKEKERPEYGTVEWSIRTSSLNKTMAPIMQSTYPHLEISAWLDVLDLRQYAASFRQFVGVEELLHFTETDVKHLGITKSAHRARIVSSLVALREKAVRLRGGQSSKLRHQQRFSMGVVHETSNSMAHHQQHDQSSPIYQFLNAASQKPPPKQSKSLDDLLDMAENVSGTDPAGPVAETLALKRALDWELSLDSRDLRSHAWYHGPIPRQRAEEIVQREGDFLIRDCVSQPGNYVLTCKSAKGPTLHFVINKILIQPETVYERVQYQFEDDAYDTVPDLITFYVGSGKAISVASGARIQFPCNRTYPLSFYATKYAPRQLSSSSSSAFGSTCSNNGLPLGVSPLNSPSMVNAGFRFNPYHSQQPSTVVGNYNSYRSPMSSPPRTKRDVPPKLPSKKQQRSQSLTPIQPPRPDAPSSGSSGGAPMAMGMSEKYCSADGVCRGRAAEHVTSTLVRSATETRRLMMGGGGAEKCNSADGVIQGANNGSMSRSIDDHSGDGCIGRINSRSGAHTLHMSRSGHLNGGSAAHSTHSLSRMATSGSAHRLVMPPMRAGSLTRGDSMLAGAVVCETDEPDSSPSPPPKPMRGGGGFTENGAGGPLGRVVSYHASGSDSGNGSGDSAQSSAAGDPLDAGGGSASSGGSAAAAAAHRSGVHIKNPRFMSASASSATLKSFADIDYAAVEQQLLDAQLPQLEFRTRFDLENFETLLLPAMENRPLDNGALNTFRMMLSETGPRVLANHLTRVDIRLILELNGGDGEASGGDGKTEQRTALDCATGVELVAMAHGEQYRRDLLERTECLRLLVAVTVLTCNGDEERADTLNKWIQVAVDTKTALGNLFGFCAIMLGLCMPQIQRLESAWHILRQRYTDSAFNFEAKLRPTLKCMNDCSNPQAPNTTVPHLLPYILLRDRGIEEILGQATSTSTLTACCITPWETSAADFGIGIMFSHLESIRQFARNLPLYQRNAQTVMSDSSSRLDELLEDAFRTEFHMKFLWGSKGAQAAAVDRHAKMEQLLTLMADKHFASCNSQRPNDPNGTPV